MSAPLNAPRPSSLACWVAALRPKTLPLGAVPVLVGSAIAGHEGRFEPRLAGAALGVSLGLQVASNLVNDVADHARGADTDARLGPPRAVAQGWLAPGQVWTAAALSLALAAGCGVFLSYHAGWELLAVGLAAILSAVAYTAGPVPLAYHGLGEAFVFVFFGLVATAGTTYSQLGRLTPGALLAGVALGALASAVLVVNNLRDLEEDAATGKRTLAVRFGPRAARLEYLLLLGAPFAALALAVGGGWLPPRALTACGALPLVLLSARAFLRARGAALNPLLARTAQLNVAFGGLLALGVCL
ncbi:MAG: 1,4-dihydroxy-2-naphthoate polyprenyltransferase [Planctomycetes bacterium]|nr:1,4-dihydroxy-2-naphthoate polyprenyltransferase [Planctomycetota bacterium]